MASPPSDHVKQQVQRDVTEIMNRPQAVEFLSRVDAQPHSIKLEDGYEFVKSEIVRWEKLGEKYGVSDVN